MPHGDQVRISHFRVYCRWRQCWGNGGQSDRGPIPPQQQQPGHLCLPFFIWWRPPQWWGWGGPVEGPQCVHRQVEPRGRGSHHREGQLHGNGGVRGSCLIHAVFSSGREVNWRELSTTLQSVKNAQLSQVFATAMKTGSRRFQQ